MFDTIPAPAAGGSGASGDNALETTRHRPVFNGRAGEYFGIWFVNLVLSVLTLGIYSAWAKVRTERYFYANTTLAGSSFEYLASPIAILKGRLVAYAVVAAMLLSAKFAPVVYLVLILAVALLMPVLIVLSLRFRARNSAWRGLSFRFDHGVGEGYGPFMLWPWLSGMTASILYPMMKKRQHDFIVEGHRYGTKRFRFVDRAGSYYRPYLIVAGAMLAGFVALGALMAAAFAGGEQAAPALGLGLMVGMGLFYLGFFIALVFLRTRYINLMWNNARLLNHQFESTLRARNLLWIYATNLLAVVFSLGLAVPWAMVRLARYRAGQFTFVATGSLDEFVAASEARTGAVGEELVEALDAGVEFAI